MRGERGLKTYIGSNAEAEESKVNAFCNTVQSLPETLTRSARESDGSAIVADLRQFNTSLLSALIVILLIIIL